MNAMRSIASSSIFPRRGKLHFRTMILLAAEEFQEQGTLLPRDPTVSPPCRDAKHRASGLFHSQHEAMRRAKRLVPGLRREVEQFTKKASNQPTLPQGRQGRSSLVHWPALNCQLAHARAAGVYCIFQRATNRHDLV